VRKLIRPEDGYTYTGFQGGEPIRFYHQEDTGKYLVGLRSDTMYYAEPTLTGWSLCSSRYLPWGKTVEGYTYPQEPKEVEFREWMYGIIENISDQYLKRLDNLSRQELKSLRDYKRKENGDEFVMNKKMFCDIMDALDNYWENLRALEKVLDVYFEGNMLTDIFEKVVDVLEEELEPQFFDPEMDYGKGEDPIIMRWLIEGDENIKTAGELYDYLVQKKDEKNISETP
jgi:hypothetical protein